MGGFSFPWLYFSVGMFSLLPVVSVRILFSFYWLYLSVRTSVKNCIESGNSSPQSGFVGFPFCYFYISRKQKKTIRFAKSNAWKRKIQPIEGE